LGYVGKKPIKTPELDDLAKNGFLFPRNYVSSFPTIPDREDLFTGKYSFPFHGWQPLGKDAVTLAQILQQNGYLTQLIADTPHLMGREANYNRGFTGYYWIRGQEGDIYLTHCNDEIKNLIPYKKTRYQPGRALSPALVDLHKWINYQWKWEEDRFMAQTARTASKWLEENYKVDNFFLWVDCFDAHEPWDPPEYLVEQYHPGYKGIPMLHPNYGPASVYTKEELKNLKAHYMGEVTLVSKWLGHIIRKLKDIGIYEETLVMFTTDHGMYVGEHNRCGKSNICAEDKRGPWPLYEEIAHIPLIIKLPGQQKSGVCQELVQPPDILPTILDLGKIKEKLPIHGHSLTPLLEGKGNWPRDYAFSSSALAQQKGSIPWTTVTTKQWTLLTGGKPSDKPELYNVEEDPSQERNLIEKHPEVAREMFAKLLKFLQRVGTEQQKIAILKERMRI